TRSRRRKPEDSAAGDPPTGRRLDPPFPGSRARGGLERADLAAHRHGSGRHHAVWAGRRPADDAAGRLLFVAPTTPGRQGASDRLAAGDGLSRIRAYPQPDTARPGSHAQRLNEVVSGGWLSEL